MFKRLRSTAVLSVCIMMFSLVQPVFAEYRTGSAEGDAVAYGAGAGALAAAGAAAILTFFTGGVALPFVLGAGALGVASGAYYGYKDDDKTLKKDLEVAGIALVGGGVAGGAGVAIGAATAAGGGATALGIGGALNEASKNKTSYNTTGTWETSGVLNDTSKYSSTQNKYDDKGKLYRNGNQLVPNNSYSINGYNFTTDSLGRISSASGYLHLKNRDGRLPIYDTIEDIGKGYQAAGDDRGHLIGDQFDGPNGLENMIPQNAKINRVDVKNFENQLAKEVKAGKTVKLTVTPQWGGNSRRPESIIATYVIDGKQDVRIFPNMTD